MRETTLEHRVSARERQAAKLLEKLGILPRRSWIEQISGVFVNAPAFDEAMKLGREYRESLRPKITRAKRTSSRVLKRKK